MRSIGRAASLLLTVITAVGLTVDTPGPAAADVPGYSVTHVAGFAGSNGGVETLAISPDGTTAYVAGESSNVAVLNLVSRRIVATIVEPASSGSDNSTPIGGAFSSNGSTVYLVNQDGTLTVINATTHTITGRIGAANQGADATGVAIRGTTAYVTERGLGVLALVDLVARRTVRTVTVGTGRSAGVAIPANGGSAFVWGGSGVAAVDLSNYGVSSVSVTATSSAVVSPAGDTVYAAAFGGVTAIDVANKTVTHSSLFGAHSNPVLTGDGKYLYYGGNGQYHSTTMTESWDAVYRIETSSWTVTEYDVPHDEVGSNDDANEGATTGTARLTPNGASLVFADGGTASNGGVVSSFNTAGTMTFTGWYPGLGYLGATSGATAALPASGSVAYIPTIGDTAPYNGVDVLDTATASVIAVIPIPYGARGVAVSRDGGKLLAVNSTGVFVLDPATRSIVKTLPIAGVAGPIVFAANGRTAYVSSANAVVSVIDTSGAAAAFTVINTLNMPGQVAELSAAPDGKHVFALSDTKVTAIDTTTGSVRSVDLASSTSLGLAVSPNSAQVYVSTSDGHYGHAVVLLSAATLSVIGSVAFSGTEVPTGLVTGPTGALYASVYLAGRSVIGLADVDVIARTRSMVVTSSWVAGQPAISPNGRTIYAYGYYDPRYGGMLDVVHLAARLTATPTPAISGTAKVGSTLTARPGSWTPAPVTLKYQWYASGKAIGGATRSTYKLTAAQLGRSISVHVTGSRSGYATVTRSSSATKPVVRGTLTTHAPTIAGLARVGHTLAAKPGSWTPAPVTLKYQWYASGRAIGGATRPTYKLTAARIGTTMRVRVTGSQLGYTTVTRMSAAAKVRA